jgi:hypothetical protein
MAHSVDAVYNVIENARAVLTYEEREALADALIAGGSGAAAVSPRSAKFLDRLQPLLGDASADAVRAAAEYLTEPGVDGPRSGGPAGMSDDELEREIERRRRYSH